MENNVHLIEWPYDKEPSEKNIEEMMNRYKPYPGQSHRCLESGK